MAFRQRDISGVDDPIRMRQALQAIATEARVANVNMPALELQAEDPIRLRQGMQALLAKAKNATIQASGNQNDEPVDAIGGTDGRGRLQVLANNFENDFL